MSKFKLFIISIIVGTGSMGWAIPDPEHTAPKLEHESDIITGESLGKTRAVCGIICPLFGTAYLDDENASECEQDPNGTTYTVISSGDFFGCSILFIGCTSRTCT